MVGAGRAYDQDPGARRNLEQQAESAHITEETADDGVQSGMIRRDLYTLSLVLYN